MGSAGKLVRVEQADGNLVVGVGREAVAVVELGRDGLRIAAHQPLDLLLRGLVAGGGVVARQAAEHLPKAVTGAEAVHVLERKAVVPVVPSAHVVAGSRHARALAERLEQAVLVKRAIEGVVGFKLLAHRAFQQLNVPVIRTG